jgi:hypothetical protein
MSQQEENPRSVATRRRVTVAAHWKDAARQQHPEATDEEIIRAAEELRHRHNSETATRAIGVRLAREDPNAMTSAARSSSRHVKSLDRWTEAAREQQPDADDEKIALLAAELRSAYYSELGTRSGASKRAKAPGRRQDDGAAATLSSRQVKSLARWEEAAREQHPGADDEKIALLAVELRSAYYSELGRRSGASKRARAAGRREGRQDAAGAGEPVTRPARRRPGR